MDDFEKRMDSIFNKDIELDNEGASRLLEILSNNNDKKINYKDIDVVSEIKESTKWLKKYIDNTRNIGGL